ncbi:uncharacterized protein LOC134800357 [Cydia splendana]|uniref:uncharacterized protein LOC134800357 n=1 Tax=Cydia splendana TaxID=1100963 RepID=UPI00300D16B4
MVERLHRQLKAAIMCHTNTHWTEVLPLVLLGIRSAWKDDLKSSAAELVYGEPLRLPGEFFAPTSDITVDYADFASRLRNHISNLNPVPGSRHVQRAFYVPKDLSTADYVFLRQGPAKRALDSPYTGPYKVLRRGDKTFKIDIRGKENTVTIDRLKPAYMTRDDDSRGSSPVQAPTTATPVPVEPATTRKTRCGRSVRFPDYYRP